MRSLYSAALAATVCLFPLSAQAELFNFTFEGFVDRTNGADNIDVPNIGDLNVDDAVSGSFTFDGSAFDGTGSGTPPSFAQAVDAISNFMITVDGYLYTATGLGSAFLYDNHMPGIAADVTDAFFANSGQLSGADQGGLVVTGAQFSIGTIIDLAILNDLFSPDLAQFSALIAANSFDGNTNILGFGTGEDVRFSLLSVGVQRVDTNEVPLPASALLLLGGLAGLGAMRRRQR